MSKDTAKDKLINSMKLTKAGTATTNTATDKKEEPVVAQTSQPANKIKKAISKAAGSDSSFSRGRVWPD